jgi:hypothetical protein
MACGKAPQRRYYGPARDATIATPMSQLLAFLTRTLALPALLAAPLAAATPSAAADPWQTDAEASAYARTPRHADTRAWLERLDAASDAITLTRFGISPGGRDLLLVIANADGITTPAAARAAGKRVLLVQGGIHAGEIEGKDAGLALLRDLTVRGRHQGLLDDTVLLFVPIFNVDGHERMSPYHRINQNGPAEMGWRGTGQNLNLNRDHLKADAPEMRAWLALWQAWHPDLLVDIHTTNGADYQYQLTWYLEEWGNQHPAVRAWQQAALVGPRVPGGGAARLVGGPVHQPRRPSRHHQGPGELRLRPALLDRVRGAVAAPGHPRRDAHAEALRRARGGHRGPAGRTAARVRPPRRRARARTGARRPRALAAPGKDLPILFKPTDQAETFRLAGVAVSRSESLISGDVWTRYDPATRKTYEVPFYRDMMVAKAARLPAAYAIAPGWVDAIDRIAAHGCAVSASARRSTSPPAAGASTTRSGATRPFEGRIGLAGFAAVDVDESVALEPGTVIVPMDQVGAAIAAHLFEPDAPDSLLRWGFFNAAFEQKEYADARKAEQLARDMLAADPSLQDEFDRALADPAFAANPQARLNWFYLRSRWADPRMNRLPVWRLDAAALAAARACRRKHRKSMTRALEVVWRRSPDGAKRNPGCATRWHSHWHWRMPPGFRR